MPPPIVTLTTDFGLSDHYVGTMKGVILNICPQVQIVDISHEVTPFAIAEGAYIIAQAYTYFPAKSIHVVVVDPGVGAARRPILLEAAGQYFVAPDNGVLGLVYAREEHTIRAIANQRFFRLPLSGTFHGRDVFSPVAAHLANGTRAAAVGKKIDDFVRPAFATPVRLGRTSWQGRILKIDRFGNVITNFPASDFPNLESRDFRMVCRRRAIRRFARTYAEGRPGDLFLIPGSAGFLEISANQASAAGMLGCSAGEEVRLQW